MLVSAVISVRCVLLGFFSSVVRLKVVRIVMFAWNKKRYWYVW